MSHDAFLEALYDADKALEKFAAAPRQGCACLQDGGQSRR